MNEIIVISKDELRQMIADVIKDVVKPKETAVWLKPKEIVDMLGISRTTLHRFKKAGYIKPNTLGRYNKHELEKLMNNGD